MYTLLFPGQGSQAPGMGRALAESFAVARQRFEEADDALSFHLSKTCFEGPEDALRRTEITQPAILTTSIAALEVLKAEGPPLKPAFAAGHSLGEWTALVASSALDFADAVRLVHQRGRFMQEAVPEGRGAMAAIIGLSPQTVAEKCQEVAARQRDTVGPANFNSNEQTVISGEKEAVSAACAALLEAGAKRAVDLPVSAPFHSPLMKPAETSLSEALQSTTVHPLQFPVVSNVEAQPNNDADRVKGLLIQQVTAPVRWVESIEFLTNEGQTTAFEIGPGRVLQGLARRIDRRLKVHGFEDPKALQKTIDALVQSEGDGG